MANEPDNVPIETNPNIERIATAAVDIAYHVHRALGPGLLESAYQICYNYELLKRGFEFKTEVMLPVNYDGMKVDAGFRVDLIIEQSILVEHKAVQAVSPIHEAQILTYLRLSNLKVGFLINWNVLRIKDGMRRFVYHL